MPVWSHRIADVEFQTACETPIKALDAGRFTPFRSRPQSADVCHHLHAVNPEELDAPPVSPALKSRLSACTSPEQLGRGIQVFVPYRKGAVAAALRPFLQCAPGTTDVPIARAARVRAQLERAAEHPADVFLIRHALSVEIMDLARHEAHVFFAEGAAESWWAHPDYSRVENGVRRLFCAFMPGRAAFPIHSSAVVRDGRAALFVAPDGGGKSTVARLAGDGAAILSDDRNILRRHPDGLRVHGTPWGRTCTGPASAPLGAVYLLQKAARFELAPIGKKDMISFLWQDNALIWAQLPVSHRVQALDCLSDMIRESPTYRLRFPKDRIDWDAVGSAMSGH